MDGLEFARSGGSSVSGEEENNKAASNTTNYVSMGDDQQREAAPSASASGAGYYGRSSHPTKQEQQNQSTNRPLNYKAPTPLSSGKTSNNQLSRQQQPVLVQTVDSDDENGDNDDEDHNNNKESNDSPAAARLVISCMPRTQEQAIQLGMTLLFTLFCAGAFFSFISAKNYRFVVGVVWLLLLFLFILLIHFVQSGALTKASPSRGGRRAFHPFLHAAADFISTEIDNFKQDWRDQVLLITYDGPYETDNNNENDDDAAENPSSSAPEENVLRGKKDRKQRSKKKKQKKNESSAGDEQPRSRFFRAFVKPILPLIRRKRNKEHLDPRGDIEIA